MSTCARCHAAMIDHAMICNDCTDHLAGRLQDVPVLLAELDIAFSRQSRIGTGPKIRTGKASSVTPDMNISSTASFIRNACAGWAHAYDGYIGPAPWFYLWTSLDKVRLQTWVVMLDADLARRMSDAWQKIDRPEGKWFAGVCGAPMDHPDGIVECGHVLWASIEDTEIECRACRSVWSVAERRAWLIRSAEDFELAPKAAAMIVSFVMDTRLSDSTLKSWLRRGHLVPRQREPQKVRVGDVIEVVLRRQAADAGQSVEEVPA